MLMVAVCLVVVAVLGVVGESGSLPVLLSVSVSQLV